MFRRKRARNPWGGDPILSGWVPGTSERLDLFAMCVSLANSQWELARAQVRLGRMQIVLAFLWVAVSVLNVVYMIRGW